jgi:cell division protein FtsB
LEVVTRAEAPVRTDSFRPVLGAAVVLFLALLAIAALKSYRDLASARAHEHRLETQIADTVARSERLRVRIDRLRHDPGMLERLAREDLGMVYPRDVIIELPDGAVAPRPHPPAPSPAPSPPPSPGEGEIARHAITQESDFVGPPAPWPPVPVPASGPPGQD